MYRIMKYSLDSSSTRHLLLLLRSSAGSRFLCSLPQISDQAAVSPEKDPIDAEESSTSDVSASGSTMSLPKVTQTLRAGKIENGIDCNGKLIVNGVIPRKIARKNRKLRSLLRRNLIGQAQEHYKKMKCDAASVDIMMSECLKLGEHDKAYDYFFQAKERGIELDQSCYAFAIYILCIKQNSKLALELLMEMRDKKWVPHVNTFTNVTAACVKQGYIVDAFKFRDEMLSSGQPMNLAAATSLIKGYCILGDIDCAIDMFQSLGHLVPDIFTFSVLIDGCCKDKRVAKAHEIYSQMKAMKIQPNLFHVNSLIRAYLEESSFEDGLKVLEEAVDMGIANLFTYNSVLSWLCKNGRVTEALDLWDKMVSRGVAPSVVSYNNLILLHCKGKKTEAAVETFSDMVQSGLNPDIVTLSVLIQGCGKKKRVAKAREIYSHMKYMKFQPSVFNVNSLLPAYLEESSLEDGLRVLEEAVDMGTVNHFTYNYVFSWLHKWGRVTEALDLWDKMVSRGVAPSAESHNNLICLHCKYKNMKAAFETFSDMVRSGLNPDAKTYSVLIKACFKNGKTKQALNVFDQMKLSGIVPSNETMNTVINVLCKSGHSMKAKSLLENREGFAPTCQWYNCIIDGFIKEANMEIAVSTVEEMSKNGVSPNVVTYKTLINGLCNENMDLAQKMWDRMKDDSIKLALKAYKVLIDGYCQNRDMETALKLYSTLLETGLSPNTKIYNALMSGYQNVQNIDAALHLSSKMIKKGVPGDLVTYTILVGWLIKEGKLESGSGVYSAMISDGVKPEDVLFMVLINGLRKKEQVDFARRVFKEMVKSGLGASVKMYHALIVGYFKQGNMEKALRLLDEMLERGVQLDCITYDVLISGEKSYLPIAS